MAPTTPGAGPEAAALEPLAEDLRSRFPEPRTIARELISRIDLKYAARIAGRSITMPEDTHQTIREINDYKQRLVEYSNAFDTAARHVEGLLEQELIEAVGEAAPGEPAKSMSVPDGAQVIQLDPVYDIDRDIDMEQVIHALAVFLLSEMGLDRTESIPLSEAIQFAEEVAHHAIALHRKADPSIKAVLALAAHAGARCDDNTAAAIRSAIGKTRRTYRDRIRVTYKAS